MSIIQNRFQQIFEVGRKEVIKGALKRNIEPYLEVLESEAGLNKDDFRYLVENNISFFNNILPKVWRQQLIDGGLQYQDFIERVDLGSDGVIYLFMEALSELREWFPEVITRQYIESEISHFRNALEQRGR